MSDSEYDDPPETPGKSETGDGSDDSDIGTVRDPVPLKRGRRRVLNHDDLSDADFDAGFKVISSMTAAQMDKLITTLEAHCPPTDALTVNLRTKRLEWDKVGFDKFTGEECRVAWHYIRQQTRKHRIMNELLQEIKLASHNDIERFRRRLMETAPGFPKRPPPTAATLFVRELWRANPENSHLNFMVFQKECIEKYNKLDEATHESWQAKLDAAVEEYDQKQKEFYAKYPKYKFDASRRNKKAESRRHKLTKIKTEKVPGRPKITTVHEQAELYPDAPKPPTNPQGEFLQSKLNKLDRLPTGTDLAELKLKYTEKYQKLSDIKKGKWIMKVLQDLHHYMEELEKYQQEHPDYITRPIKLRNYLSKADIDNWAYLNGQPEKPAGQVFEHFWRKKYNDPEYAKLPERQGRKLAELEFKTLDAYDKELCKMEFRRSVLDYKRDIERFFDWTPDILKPHILMRIPKKYQPVIMTHIEKLPVSMLLEEEEKAEFLNQEDHDDEEDPLAVPESPSKKKKKKKKSKDDADADTETDAEPLKEPPSKKRKRNSEVAKAEVEESPSTSTRSKKKKKSTKGDDDDDDIIVYVDQDKILNGKKAKGQPTPKPIIDEPKWKLKNKKPSPDDFFDGLLPTTQDCDDMIRGILDAKPLMGRNYSAVYYYAKYIAGEHLWWERLRKRGLMETARMMFDTFTKLSHHKKNIFIHQSWEWYQQYKPERLWKCNAKCNILMPGEPPAPPRTACALYQFEMDLRTRIGKHKKGFQSTTPKWGEIGEENQYIYIKKHYRDTKKYAQQYEDYLMKLNPDEFLLYTMLQSRNWERRIATERPSQVRAAWRAFIFPFPSDLPKKEDVNGGESDTEILEEEIFRQRDVQIRLYNRLPSVLDNDDFIKNIAKKVTPEQRTEEELMAIADESSTDQDDGF